MATLTIEGQSVTVDDSFRSMTPEQQEAAVEEISASLGVQPSSESAALGNQLSQSSQQLQGSATPIAEQQNQGSFIDPIRQGLTFGFSDEIDAVTGGVGRALQGGNFGEGFEQGQTQSRERLENFRERHPIGSTALEIAGSIPSSILGGGAAAALKIAPRIAPVLGPAITGGIEGAIYGTGAANGDLGDRAAGAGFGALGGSLGGAVLQGAGNLLGRGANAVRNTFNPQGAGGRTVGQTAIRDAANPNARILSQSDEAFAEAVGQPLINADRGGGATRDLFRTAANFSPEAREQVAQTVSDRFQTQTPRTVEFFNRMFGGQVDDLARQAEIRASAKRTNNPAYRAAYDAPTAQGVWNARLQGLLQSDAVQNAIGNVSTISSNRTALTGQAPIRNPFTQGADGQWQLARTSDGALITPNLQFWDEVQRGLRAQSETAMRGSNPNSAMANDISELRRVLNNELDTLVPEFGTARTGARGFFGAEDALEAGQNAWRSPRNIGQARRAFGQLSDAEKQDFSIGMVSEIISTINTRGDTTDLVRYFASPARRELLEMGLGQTRARHMETFLHIEGIMNKTRAIATGNSNTAQQLISAGALGGVGGLALGGGDPYSGGQGAILAMAGRQGASMIGKRVKQQIMEEVAQLLASSDPAAMNRVMQNAALSDGWMDAVRAIGQGLQRAGSASGARLTVQGPGQVITQEQRRQDEQAGAQ